MNFWGWIAVGFGLSVIAMLVWAVRHQARQFPRGFVRVGEPEEPRYRYIGKWFGRAGGGGHG